VLYRPPHSSGRHFLLLVNGPYLSRSWLTVFAFVVMANRKRRGVIVMIMAFFSDGGNAYASNLFSLWFQC